MPEDNEIQNQKNMETLLEIRQPKVTGGQSIIVKEIPTSNYIMHPIGMVVSAIMIASIEGDSNNMKAHVIPSDIRDYRTQWTATGDMLKAAVDDNDRPQTTHEEQKAFLAISPREMLKINNMRIQMVNIELDRYLRILFSQDSSNAQAFLDERLIKEEARQRTIVSNAMNMWWGDGGENKATMTVVPFRHVGTLTPPLNRNLSYYKEASSAAPAQGLQDAEDTTSTN